MLTDAILNWRCVRSVSLGSLVRQPHRLPADLPEPPGVLLPLCPLVRPGAAALGVVAPALRVQRRLQRAVEGRLGTVEGGLYQRPEIKETKRFRKFCREKYRHAISRILPVGGPSKFEQLNGWVISAKIIVPPTKPCK